MTRRSTGIGSDSAPRPSSTGWGGENATEAQSPAKKAENNGSAYSFIGTSPGYVEHVVTQARKHLMPLDATLADLFVEAPRNEKQKKARAYFLKLDHNEQAALREHYDAERDRFDVC